MEGYSDESLLSWVGGWLSFPHIIWWCSSLSGGYPYQLHGFYVRLIPNQPEPTRNSKTQTDLDWVPHLDVQCTYRFFFCKYHLFHLWFRISLTSGMKARSGSCTRKQPNCRTLNLNNWSRIHLLMPIKCLSLYQLTVHSTAWWETTTCYAESFQIVFSLFFP